MIRTLTFRSAWRCCLLNGLLFTQLAWFAANSAGQDALSPNPSATAAPTKFPEFVTVQTVMHEHFASNKTRKPKDLLTQADVKPLFPKFSKAGWKVSDEAAILGMILPESHFLPHVLSSDSGRKFMRGVSSEPLIYDRLDRISQQKGGQQMLRDLVKLPDAERYAKKASAPGVPTLVDFLPKDASGTTRQIKFYDTPTGRIYTLEQLSRRIQESYFRDKQELEKLLKSGSNGLSFSPGTSPNQTITKP